ncbi:helix-turn-helix transcriptional regulator [Romboutsia sp. 1001216sp1]|uniref:helix-turn-helix domain-containing protein n=1 Tax=unclassified Romboutsia TaxID=2626894 RepID=UPI00189AC28E|nr:MULTISPECIES: helix-turn-helix transcriptional regulator [unclassified Romboutsia]MDB8790397.1 helix-turn-helix transcriptional regulator [Romboutsia sp. 1001216sp1]
MKYMLAENLKQFKEINNLSFRELAKILKVSYAILEKLVNKKRETAKLDVICRVAEGLDVELDDLLFKNIYSN